MTSAPREISSKDRLRRWGILLGGAFVILLLDQSTKAWVTQHLQFGESWEPIPAISDFLSVTLSANRGAAFSILPQAGDLFLIIAIVMIGGILIFYRRMPPGHWVERLALGLLLGGVSGNAIDRLRLGYVVDFVHIQIRPLISNVSNFADHAIVVGIAILFLAQWIGGRTKPADAETPQKVS